MKECSLNAFLEEINPWLDSKYIRSAETNKKGHFILHFLDGTKHDYLINDCNEEQINKILKGLESRKITVTRDISEHKCTGDHQGHICVLASNGLFEKIIQITKNPEFICFNCGRVSNEACNLCNPMPLG